ncbi:MAG: tetratricopeptide repeat protein [Rhodospirillaceae bacterium]|nr:tetratricopeptide repeat protein [Rhodospirillaceae bacterium]
MTLITKRFLLCSAALALSGSLFGFAAYAAPTAPASKSHNVPGLAGALLAARHANATADNVTATDYYARALELDPTNNALLWWSYSAAATAGKMDAAIAAAKRYYDSTERPFPLAGLLLATGHYQKKEYDQAWSYIDKVQSDSYLSFTLPMIRAWAQAARNTPDAALAELAPLQNTQGLGDLYHLMGGLLNEHFGRNEDALIHYDALASKVERQPLSVIRIVAGGYHRLGKSASVKQLLEKFNTQNASVGLSDMANALQDASRFPKKVTLSDGMAETYFAISQLLSQNGGNNNVTDVSIAFGQMALYLSPDLNIARWVLGSTLAMRGRYDESSAVLTAIKKNDPSYLGAQFQIVDNLTALNQETDALAKLQGMGREYPAMPEIQMAIANLHRKAEKFAEAILAYDKAEQLYTAAKSDNWTLHYGRGVCYERTKQWPKAESDFMRALKLNPDQPDVLNYLGYSWIDRGENLTEARRLIELAYSKSPDNGFIVDSLGWAIYLTGDYKGAVSYLEKAVELEPADPTLNEHLGDVYWKVGRKKEARFQWQRALTLKPEAKQKVSLQAKLEQGLAQK